MAESTHVERLNAEFRAHHPWRRSATAVAVVFLALASVAGAATGEVSDERLSTTLLGRLVPGGEPRLAVRWDGPPGALLDVWVDLDGDGSVTTDELAVTGRPLEPGIEVVELEIASDAYVVAEPRLWVQVRDNCSVELGHAAGEFLGGASQPGCAWQPGFVFADLDGPVRALAVYDDGTGPALFAGGDFDIADGVTANNIAKWDGAGWSALSGPSGTGTQYPVRTLAVFDDGTGPGLYAGGQFSTAGWVTVNNIARWDGGAWSALSGPSGTGVDGPVSALAVYDDGSGPALYAGGGFFIAGGVIVEHIARWDGSEWSALSGPSGSGTTSNVYSLAVFDDGMGAALYAGGSFTIAGGVTVNRIARWDGAAWSALSGPSGTGMDQSVAALAVFDDGTGPALYAGGAFTVAGGVTVNRIARWDGMAWSALSGPSGTGVDDVVRTLEVFDDGTGSALYVGGSFNTAGGVIVDNIVRWDGSSWSNLSGPSGTGTSGSVWALGVYEAGTGEALYVGGEFTSTGGVPAHHVARWDGASWSGVSVTSEMGVDGWVHALTVFDDGTGPALYAGGDFTIAGGVTANRIAKWDGDAWSALSGPSGTGMNTKVYALAEFDDGTGPALYAGGRFTTAGGVAAYNIAKWDGDVWSALSVPPDNGTEGHVYALAVFDDGTGPGLFAGGDFRFAGGVTVNYVAKWDGVVWWDLSGPSGTGMTSTVKALAVFDDGTGPGLFAGGDFRYAGGVTVNHIAKWDGIGWSDLSGPSGTGVNSTVGALAVFDDGTGPGLFAGGHFGTAGGLTVNRIAKWDGIAWSDLSGPSGTGMGGGSNPGIWALTVFDDGTIPALIAGGGFTTAGGLTVNRIARWDGTAWSGLSGPSGTGTGGWLPTVYDLTVLDDPSGPVLYAGGAFLTAGGLPSSYIAAWWCEALPIFTDGFESGDTSEWSLVLP